MAFASDLHIGPTTPPALLDAAFAQLRAWAPDLLLLGGDYVFLEATAARVARLEALVASVRAPCCAAVLGNHDLWTHHDRIEAALRAAGAHILVNAALRLPAPHAGLAVVGLDDPWTGQPDADAAFAAVPDDVAGVVVLCHAPDGVPLVADRAPLLVVCGHTHGGQIALPGGRPLLVPGPLGPTYPHGEHPLPGPGSGRLWVSRGLGGVEVPVRLYAPPDVLLLTLTPRAAAGPASGPPAAPGSP